MAKSEERRAVFLDRDGVINALVYRPEDGIFDSPYSMDEFRLLTGVAEAVRRLNSMGLLAIVVSNQPGVAKGKCDHAFLDTITVHIHQQLAQQGARLDGVYYCRHHPEAIVPELRQECSCRKPKPGLLLVAAQDHRIDLSQSYMVGDNPKDIQAGLAAGCTTILVRQNPHEVAAVVEFCQPHQTANNLLEAVAKIIGEGESRGDFSGHS